MVALGSTGRILPLLVTPRPGLHPWPGRDLHATALRAWTRQSRARGARAMADPSAATWQPGLWKVCNERLGLGISMSTSMYLKCIKIII